MKKMKFLIVLLFLVALAGCGIGTSSGFQYQQQISIASQKSSADLREKVKMFIRETEVDPEVEFSKVRYYTEGYLNPIYYADVTCNVKHIDSSLGGAMSRSINKQLKRKKEGGGQ